MRNRSNHSAFVIVGAAAVSSSTMSIEERPVANVLDRRAIANARSLFLCERLGPDGRTVSGFAI
jgi:hypothetical protein